jgi:maltooligosyltrehalose trehalohydrolase
LSPPCLALYTTNRQSGINPDFETSLKDSRILEDGEASRGEKTMSKKVNEKKISLKDLSIRKLPVGAEVIRGEGVHFRVWAPKALRVSVVVESRPGCEYELMPEGEGYYSGLFNAVRGGDLYRFRLDGEEKYPDPASRFQPEGPHGPSEVIDHSSFPWTDEEWTGPLLKGQVIYEMHIGTFTSEGTWEAAENELPELSRLGVTTIEVMPVADFAGEFGWGYDGVDLFAPTRLYGRPDEMRSFVNSAHRAGLGVILDVVYNHLGPEGCYLDFFSDDYQTDRHMTDWGKSINFDGPRSKHVREFFLSNAGYWIDEFHMDGLRLDATQNIHDESGRHIIGEVTSAVRRSAAGRSTLVIAENETQTTLLLHSEEQCGCGVDALWNDDFHHSARVAMTGRREAYYSDYQGKPQEFVSLLKHGYLYQGQWYSWQKKRRGSPSIGTPPEKFIVYLENHDQVSNSLRGQRLHQITSPGKYRAMTGFLLLSPCTPMLFQGQEFGSSRPFIYFSDLGGEVGALVSKGRKEFIGQFQTLAQPRIQNLIPDPVRPDTFRECKLELSQRKKNPEIYLMHRDLLRLRRHDPVLRLQGEPGIEGAVIGDECFLIRYFGNDRNDRLLIVNLGRDIMYSPAPEPLLACCEGKKWNLLWHSEDSRYGGNGGLHPETGSAWNIAGRMSVLLASGE